jgi:ABC-2 type transport system permease protein
MLGQAIATEFIKLRRAKITWLTALGVAVGPLFGGLFMWILQQPGRAEQLGLIGQKARFVGQAADWPTYFALLTQMTGVVSVVLFSVLTAYVFGREYSDGTAKNMLGLPVRRAWFPVAKFVVVFVWCVLLTSLIICGGLVIGAALRLPGFSVALVASSVDEIVLAGLMACLLMPAVAWIAALGRGYLAPIGFALLMLLLGMGFGATGWGKWFPWSIVPLVAGVAGPRTETLAPGSLVVLGITCVAGVAATIWQFTYADNNQ